MKRYSTVDRLFLTLRFALGANCWIHATAVASAVEFQSLLEADWIEQARWSTRAQPLHTQNVSGVSTTSDAAGGCDGVKDGTWGFHTGRAKEPWWQVDLGRTQGISRVVIWNRCDTELAAVRARNLIVLLSEDGRKWSKAYQHNGVTFYGTKDGKPLEVKFAPVPARFVRVQLPGNEFLHLDDVEVFGNVPGRGNLAINRPADQVSVSQWSRDHATEGVANPDWSELSRLVLAALEDLRPEERNSVSLPDGLHSSSTYIAARRLHRRFALSNPLLNFHSILFTKRVPSSFSHMSDQYYGWWSRPGGGIYVLTDFKSDAPVAKCLTGSFKAPGTFLRPALSYDAKKVLFAWCRFYPHVAGEQDKLNKANVPEDAFFHLFEMNIDGTGVRQLTHGKYDDFDGRYLPDGRIVFLSTRRGQSVQAGRESALQTVRNPAMPDCYVRCGGGPERPVAVYTLHTLESASGAITAISPFEMFEWTPEVGHDGNILYSRWDYIDRDNMPYMGLWTIGPDGTNPRVVYGNYTKAPHCVFEPRPVPNSRKIVFTASAHHAQTMGSLVLLDPSVGVEGAAPITRVTPEVPFPEIEAWPKTYYAGPWPLSERYYLVSWGFEGATVPGPAGWNRWHAVQRPANGMALYLFDAKTGLRELLFRDPEISCFEPIPIQSRTPPPVVSSSVAWETPEEGRFLLADVYRGLKTVQRGDIKSLRIVAVPPKTHPTMNYPNMGITADDPGKCVLGTVPVEEDGSAYFRAPAGVSLFFQALDRDGMAVQTMRSVTHVQPGQTLTCVGCHESRSESPPTKGILAARREPSRITVGPEGSWPLRFDQLVKPVLNNKCAGCHSSSGQDAKAAKFDLTGARSYDSLISYGKPSLRDIVLAGYRRGYSVEGDCGGRQNAIFPKLDDTTSHPEVRLTAEDRERLIVWMDTYAQKAGAFDIAQEASLQKLRQACADFLIERVATSSKE